MFTFSWSPYPSDETKHKGLSEGHNGYYKNYHYHQITLGSVLRSSNNLPGPSYRDIKAQTVINRDGTGAPANIAEIKDNQVYLNNVLIATSPAGKSKAQKEKFCKAIVWSLINDPISLQDKLDEIFIGSMPAANLVIPDPLPAPMYPIIPEKVKSTLPVFPAGFIPWLNLTITEEAIV